MTQCVCAKIAVASLIANDKDLARLDIAPKRAAQIADYKPNDKEDK